MVEICHVHPYSVGESGLRGELLSPLRLNRRDSHSVDYDIGDGSSDGHSGTPNATSGIENAIARRHTGQFCEISGGVLCRGSRSG